MRTLHLALTDGFKGDRVIIHGSNSAPVILEQVTTRTQISLAQSIELPISEEQERIEIELPDKGVRKQINLARSSDVFLKVSLAPNGGSLEDRIVAAHEFGSV